MGERHDETVREVEEESGLMRGGARFRQEKRQRTGEGPVTTKCKTAKEDRMG